MGKKSAHVSNKPMESGLSTYPRAIRFSPTSASRCRKKCLEHRVVHVACERMVSFLAQVSHVQVYDKRQKEKNEPT